MGVDVDDFSYVFYFMYSLLSLMYELFFTYWNHESDCVLMVHSPLCYIVKTLV